MTHVIAWVITGLVAAALGVVWWFIFRGAMRHPNNGNEFSEDSIPGGGG